MINWMHSLKINIPFLTTQYGDYNRTMLLFIALERYARRLELTKED